MKVTVRMPCNRRWYLAKEIEESSTKRIEMNFREALTITENTTSGEVYIEFTEQKNFCM